MGWSLNLFLQYAPDVVVERIVIGRLGRPHLRGWRFWGSSWSWEGVGLPPNATDALPRWNVAYSGPTSTSCSGPGGSCSGWVISDSCLMDFRELSLIAWDTAVTFSKVMTERGLPDLGASSSNFPARIFALSPFTVRKGLRISPKPGCRSCQIRPPRAVTQRQFDALPIHPWLTMNGRSRVALHCVAGSARITPEAIYCLAINHREPRKAYRERARTFCAPCTR